MSKPVMRFGGSEQKTTVDFSHLESNPNYKPEEGAGDEVAAQAQAAAEAEAQAQAAVQSEAQKTPQELADEQAAQAQAAAQTALNTNQDVDNQSQLSEELLFSTLSEKLGREVKSYEDLIQEPMEIDPRVKELNEWSRQTGRPMEDYFKVQKDYSQVSDEDVAREYLRTKYPTFTDEELAYKMQTMLPDEDDLDEDKIKKGMEMKIFTGEARQYFQSVQKELSKPVDNLMTDEVKEKVSYYDQIKAQIDGQAQASQDYFNGLRQASSATDKLKLNLGEGLDIDFNVAEDKRKNIPEFINDMPHWKKQDGSWNHEAVVQDAYKIKFFDELIKLAYEQGMNSGQSQTIKGQNNITLDAQKSAASQTQDTGAKKPVIEGIDKILGGQKLKFKF